MAASTVLVVVLVGVAVGLVSGLIGIGGGVLIVPFLYFFYDRPDLFGVLVRPEARPALAHGTSLFVIAPTALQGALAYHRAGLVEWSAAKPIGLVSIAGAAAGASLALVLPAAALKAFFGVLLIYAGVRLVLGRAGTDAPREGSVPVIPLREAVGIGSAVGVLSSLLGVGGGLIAMPLLIRRVGVKKVAATSIAIIMVTALAGTLAYMWNGRAEAGLPTWSVGYVDVAAGAAMFPGSLLAVRWGVALNQRLGPRVLALLFATTFVALGARLLGPNLAALLGR